jgi:hypothetical protein
MVVCLVAAGNTLAKVPLRAAAVKLGRRLMKDQYAFNAFPEHTQNQAQHLLVVNIVPLAHTHLHKEEVHALFVL